MIHNSISGKVEQISLDEYLSRFDPTVHDQIKSGLARPDVDGAMIYENLQMDSSRFGDRSSLIFGPGCSTTSLESAAERRLGDVPSRFQYPQAYYLKPKE